MHFCTIFVLLVGPLLNSAAGQNEESLFNLPINSITGPDPCLDGSCQVGAVETGHKMYQQLTEDVVGVERCYSFCFANVSNGRSGLLDVYGESNGLLCVNDTWTEAFVCLGACLSQWSSSVPEGSAVLNGTCSEFCLNSDVCERSLGISASASSSCVSDCRSTVCPRTCEHVKASFPLAGVLDMNAQIPSGLELRYAAGVGLRAQGMLEAGLTSATPPPDTASHGVIWRITSISGNETFYVPQHLPFLLSPAEVGPLYRAGSNTMAIQQLQCRQGLQLSYALVSQQGRTNFSQPTAQCFFGKWYPSPPKAWSITFDFIYERSGVLQFDLHSPDVSSDHEHVREYRVEVYGARTDHGPFCFGSSSSTPSLIDSHVFSDKNNLSLKIEGPEDLTRFFHIYKEGRTTSISFRSCRYFFKVYAVPVNGTLFGSPPESMLPSTTIDINIDFPPIPLEHNVTVEIQRNHTSGRADIVGTFSAHWKVFAATSSMMMFVTVPNRDTGVVSLGFGAIDIEEPITVNKTAYSIVDPGVKPYDVSRNPKRSDLYFTFSRILTDIPSIGTSKREYFQLPLLKPSAVRNLTVDQKIDSATSRSNVTISWLPPARTEGAVVRYEIEVSSTDITIVYSGRVEGSSIVDGMMEVVVEFDLISVPSYIYTVYAVSEFGLEGARVNITVPIPTTASPGNEGLPQFAVVLIVLAPLVVILVVIIVVFLALCFVYHRMNKPVNIPLDSQLRFGSGEEGEDGYNLYDMGTWQPLDEWEVSPIDIVMENFLGEGNFGEVYRGHVRDTADRSQFVTTGGVHVKVAIKLIRSDAPGELKQDFLKEIATMKKIAVTHCPYVVNMVGCCTQEEPLALVLELVSNGDLLSFLRASRTPCYGYTLPGGGDQPYPNQQGGGEGYVGTAAVLSGSGSDGGGGGSTPSSGSYVNSPSQKASEKQPTPPEEKDSLKSKEYDQLEKMKHFQKGGRAQSVDSGRYISVLTAPGGGGGATRPAELPASSTTSLSSDDLVSFAFQITSGMAYLASQGIVHRDLACRNVLVGDNKCLKISDFGLARENDIYIKTTDGRLPVRWMAIESITDRVYTTKSDVWSFGVTLWEVVTLGGHPYADIGNKALLQRLCQGYRMEQPANCSSEIYEVMVDCWNQYPTRRPTFPELVARFDDLVDSSKNDHLDYIKVDTDAMLPYTTMAALQNGTTDPASESRTDPFTNYDPLLTGSNNPPPNSYFDQLVSKQNLPGTDGPYFDQLVKHGSSSLPYDNLDRSNSKSGNANGLIKPYDHFSTEPEKKGTSNSQVCYRPHGNQDPYFDKLEDTGNVELIKMTSFVEEKPPSSGEGEGSETEAKKATNDSDSDTRSISSGHIAPIAPVATGNH